MARYRRLRPCKARIDRRSVIRSLLIIRTCVPLSILVLLTSSLAGVILTRVGVTLRTIPLTLSIRISMLLIEAMLATHECMLLELNGGG